MQAEPAQLDRVFHALSDASRRAMVDRLSRGPASVMELAEPLTIALPSVLKHLRVLEEGGIVRSEKSGRVRTYRIEVAALDQIERWVSRRKATWNDRFDRLDRFLVTAPRGKRRTRKD